MSNETQEDGFDYDKAFGIAVRNQAAQSNLPDIIKAYLFNHEYRIYTEGEECRKTFDRLGHYTPEAKEILRKVDLENENNK